MVTVCGGARCWGSGVSRRLVWFPGCANAVAACVGVWWVSRVVVENCIVDASIFVL